MERQLFTRNGRIAVRAARGMWHLVATGRFRAGERILTVEGEIVDAPNRYSIQLGEKRHLDVPAAVAADVERVARRYPWRFLNHSCQPNAALRGRALVALRPVAPRDEITFDYNTTEYELESPFRCHCGACGGREIGGFARLTPAERAQLAPHLAPHLRRRLDGA